MTLAQLRKSPRADQRILAKKREALHADLRASVACPSVISERVAGVSREEKPALPYWVGL